MWNEDKENGKGTLTLPNGKSIDGELVNSKGVFKGGDPLVYENGHIFFGKYKAKFSEKYLSTKSNRTLVHYTLFNSLIILVRISQLVQMSVTTLYSNKTGDLFEGRVFKYTAGTEVIGEKGIRIDPRGFIRGGGVCSNI